MIELKSKCFHDSLWSHVSPPRHLSTMKGKRHRRDFTLCKQDASLTITTIFSGSGVIFYLGMISGKISCNKV